MAKLPEPPAPGVLAGNLPPSVKTLPKKTRFWRVYFQGGSYPVEWNEFRYFGPVATSRFDPHLPHSQDQERGILYASSLIVTCFAEAFQEGRFIDTRRNEPYLASFDSVRSLKLLDLTGAWPTQAGASMKLTSGSRLQAQKWARAIYDAYPDLEGLWYPSSMYGNRPAVALFERAESALPEHPSTNRTLADGSLTSRVGRIAHRLKYGIG